MATGDGGAWLEGDAARRIACQAMIIPVVTGDIDPAAIEDLITACVHYQRLRAQAGQSDRTAGQSDGADGPDGAAGEPAAATAPPPGTAAGVLAGLEHQILAQVLRVVSGPGWAASFLRRNLLGKPLGGPSLPL